MLHADALDGLSLCIVELVQIAVDIEQVKILVKVGFKILNRCPLAHRLTDARYDKVTEYIIRNLVEANAVIHLIKNQPMSVYQEGINI